jgi:hypothetical protein
MVVHLVLFRPRANLADQAVRAFLDAVATAQQRIPSIRGFRVGRRVTHGRPYEQLMREDFPYAAILEFDDVEGLKAYLQHPAHTALGEGLFEALEAGLIYDYDVRDASGARELLETPPSS